MDTTNHKMYWNLHKECWSVKPAYRGGKVSHAYVVGMEDVRLVVQPAGRERVRREGKKNVHAYAKGQMYKRLVDPITTGDLMRLHRAALEAGWRRVTYNPYATDTFVDVDNGMPVLRAHRLLALPNASVWYLLEVAA